MKLIQDLRGLVKVFSILASTESLVLTLFFLAFFGVSMICELCIFHSQQESWEVIIFEGTLGFYIDRNFICNHWLLF